MEEIINKAKTLMEALPYIKEYHGKIVVIKYGGNAMKTKTLKESVISDIVLMKFVGLNPIIVHGGGPQITEHLKKIDKKTEFVDGQRVTDKETMEIVKMVLVEKINKEIVSLLIKNGAISVGISGEDGQFIRVNKIKSTRDVGFVGEVKNIRKEVVIDLVNDGYIPVIATIGVGDDGDVYNINADNAVGEIASAVKASKLIFLTDVNGLYEDYPKNKNLISSLNLNGCKEIIKKKVASQGMIPKIKGAITALQKGVEKVHLLNGTIPHALLLEIFTNKGVGTMILKK
ncbi:MAG: acetylglutamate kinase [Actinomycetia bacterium]|nr:acetylglutamate kinase [Actinomycetes bacterium]